MNKKELENYFNKKLNKAFQNEFELYIWNNTISTNIDAYDDELIKAIDFKKCKEIFPKFSYRVIEYEYPSDDDMSSNESAEEIYFIGIESEYITKENIDKLCDILASSYYLRE